MADAAERYCATWGKDKVTEVTGCWWNATSPAEEGKEDGAVSLDEARDQAG